MPTREASVRQLSLPLFLICVHSALLILLGFSISTSRDPEAAMAWVLPYYLDFPTSLLNSAFVPMSDLQATVFFLIAGGVQWIIIGAIIQSLWRGVMRGHERASR
jgi:hypothetical protein